MNGKYTFRFSFSTTISPGSLPSGKSLPNICQIAPNMINTMPPTINHLAIGFTTNHPKKLKKLKKLRLISQVSYLLNEASILGKNTTTTKNIYV